MAAAGRPGRLLGEHGEHAERTAPSRLSDAVRAHLAPLTFAGSVLGLGVGMAARAAGAGDDVATVLMLPGELFIRSLKMMVAPLVFCSIVCSMNGEQPLSSAVPGRTAMCYAFTTAMAAAEGLAFFALYDALGGDRWHDATPFGGRGGAPTAAHDSQAHASLRPVDAVASLLRQLVPDNAPRVLVDRQLLSVVGAAVALGAGIRRAPRRAGGAAATLLPLAHGTSESIVALMQALSLLAPVGVCSLVAGSVARTADLGAAAGSVGRVVLAMSSAMAFHAGVTLALMVRVLARPRGGWAFLRGMAEAAAVALGTSSSVASLPTTVRCVVAQGVREQTARFVLPLGATVNMDGSTIMLVFAVLYIARTNGALAWMTPFDRLHVALIASALSVGSAPVPSSGLLTVMLACEVVGVPVTTALAYLIAVDWLLDRLETVTNVLSDACVCACVDAAVSGSAAAAPVGPPDGAEGCQLAPTVPQQLAPSVDDAASE